MSLCLKQQCLMVIASVWNLHKFSRLNEYDKLHCKLGPITCCKMIWSMQVCYYCYKSTLVQKRGLIRLIWTLYNMAERKKNVKKKSKNFKPIIVFTCHQLSAPRTLKVKPNQTNANWWIWTSFSWPHYLSWIVNNLFWKYN